jgi:hypothetical protein
LIVARRPLVMSAWASWLILVGTCDFTATTIEPAGNGSRSGEPV